MVTTFRLTNNNTSILKHFQIYFQATLRCALKYLYSGSSDVLSQASSSSLISGADPEDSGDLSSLALLQQEFGTPNSLESDIAYLWESSTLADCRLTFNYSDKSAPEVMCHRTILAARSGFFRRLIQRRLKSNPLLSSSVLEICLDSQELIL